VNKQIDALNRAEERTTKIRGSMIRSISIVLVLAVLFGCGKKAHEPKPELINESGWVFVTEKSIGEDKRVIRQFISANKRDLAHCPIALEILQGFVEDMESGENLKISVLTDNSQSDSLGLFYEIQRELDDFILIKYGDTVADSMLVDFVGREKSICIGLSTRVEEMLEREKVAMKSELE